MATGATQESHFYDVFNSTWRRRTIPLILATLLGEFAGAGIAAWPFYHATTEVGLSSANTSLVMLVGGTIGIAGLAIGAWASERYGPDPIDSRSRSRDDCRSARLLLGSAEGF